MWGGFVLIPDREEGEAILSGHGETLTAALEALRDKMRSPWGIKFTSTDATQETIVRYDEGRFRELLIHEADALRERIAHEVRRIRDREPEKDR